MRLAAISFIPVCVLGVGACDRGEPHVETSDQEAVPQLANSADAAGQAESTEVAESPREPEPMPALLRQAFQLASQGQLEPASCPGGAPVEA